MSLPKRIGEWTRLDAARRVTADTIFDYMDGAGELYLAYRFDHLDVFEYKQPDASLGTLLVELYSMKTPDDAFGLLSNDWGGEVPEFDRARPRVAAGGPSTPPQRALYGGGLLRIWHRALYVRILAARETPESREAVLALGRGLTAEDGQATDFPQPPAVLDRLSAASRTPRRERTCFFRSHLVLNSAYFLASQDILGLGLDVDAATTEYPASTPGERPTRIILIRYPSDARARTGLQSFVDAYLPEGAAKRTIPGKGAAKVEHGWVGWALQARDLALAVDAPASQEARALPAAIVAPVRPEGSNRF